MRSPSRDSRTQPVPSMPAWADGSASTANTASGAASIVVDAVTRSVSIPVRRLAGPELIAARDVSPTSEAAPSGDVPQNAGSLAVRSTSVRPDYAELIARRVLEHACRPLAGL